MRLKDKVAIVTGASSDIGASIVKRFVEEGAKVVLIGRNLDSLEKVRKECGDESATASMVCDITDEGQLGQTVDQVIDVHGKIDILVNGAGALNDPIHFHEMPTPEIKKMIHTNILGVFFPTKAVLNKMSEVKRGVIINIGSISSERAIPRVHLAVYSSTKAAIAMFTKSIAVEYARRNIRCNCINPGIINSGMIKPYLDDPDAKKVLEDRLPLNRIGEPVDVANAVLFMASDEANWITGTVLDVDGGKSASEA
ncbi:MAG: SDR family oxidoreductase [Nitrosopumilaceae archaeon]|nr:SDR family oxidoreductase [Nitrosopumilaceae archaeon]